MGNRLSLLEYEDSRPVDAERGLAYYKSVDLKFAKSFLSQIAEHMLSDFDINDDREVITWKRYLRTFCDLRDRKDPQNERTLRSTWHPSTLGYIMERADEDIEGGDLDNDQPSVREGKGSDKPADDSTDDDASESSSSDDDESSSSSDEEDDDVSSANDNLQQGEEETPKDAPIRSSVKKSWDITFTNPIFFGYTKRSAQQHEADTAAVVADLKEKEERAVVRARVSRGALIDEFELSSKNQETNRLNKIHKIENLYSAARTRRETLLQKMSGELPPMSFVAFKNSWERDYQAAEDSYDSEVQRMIDFNSMRCAADKEVLQSKVEEFEAFKNAESQELPSGHIMEEIARKQLVVSSDLTVERQVELAGFRADFVVMQGEYGEAQGRGASISELQVLRSVMNVSETSVREGQRNLTDAMDVLNDSELLLSRANRIKLNETHSLPLFCMLSDGVDVSEVRLDLLVCAIVALMSATYDQKCAFFFNLFDPLGEGFYSGPFLFKVCMLFCEMFFRIGLLPQSPDRGDVSDCVYRAFRDLGLDSRLDSLSLPESKRLLITLLSKSYPLADCLAVKLGFNGMKAAQDMYVRPNGQGGGSMGTYQRNTMTAIGSLLKGMIGPSACKYRMHVETTRYRPQLEFSRKQIMHERALGQGDSDPLKADYSRYFNRSKDKGEVIVPLDVGHLKSIKHYTEKVVHVLAAVKIQSMIRARFGRKTANIAAKRQAYREARDAAIDEMKERVLEEFKKKEATTGASKMKWDAQVKSRQNKLTASGEKVGRSSTVMLMMKESVGKAEEDIISKFDEIEERENFTTFEFGGQVKVLTDVASNVENLIISLFDIHLDRSVGYQGQIVVKQEVQNGEEEEEQGGELVGEADSDVDISLEGSAGYERGSADEDSSLALFSVVTSKTEKVSVTEDPLGDAFLFTSLQLSRFKKAVLGTYELDLSPYVLGECLAESTVRLAMSSAEPSDDGHLVHRLRAVDSSVTLLKARRLISENPSKRLLMRYVEAATSDEALLRDLSGHFQFVRHEKELVAFLRCIVRSDFERGVLMRELAVMENVSESSLRSWFRDALAKGVDDLSDVLERRLLNAEHSSEEEVLLLEENRVQNCALKFDIEAFDIISAIQKLRDKSKRVLLSQQNVRRKLLHVKILKGKRYGTYVPPTLISVSDRHNWLLRYSTAMRGGDDTAEEREGKYEEIRAVCSEFLSIATADALIILSETFLPPFSKTIPIGTEFAVHGRSMVSGRGHDGGNSQGEGTDKGDERDGPDGDRDGSAPLLEGSKHYTYELHNIVYTVIEDQNGIFNGSDDFAMKAAGNDRLGSLEFAKAHLSRIQVPLTATIDYFGFRVLAVSKLPSERVLYSPEGEIRRITEEQVHGMQSNGDYFINKSRDLQSLLEGLARQLNLAKHYCQGLKDLGPKMESTFISAETTVYKDEGTGGEDTFGPARRGAEDFYLKDFWRTFPPEIPEETAHLSRTPRDQSVFWRLLRPELVRNYSVPLNPDCACMLAQRAPDQEKHYSDLCLATRSISQTLVPDLVESLMNRDYPSSPLPLSEGYGLDLAKEMHCRGINVRHLGLARSLLFRPLCGYVNVFFHDCFLRTSRDLRLEVRNGERVCIGGVGVREQQFVITETDTDKITHDRLPISIRYTGESVINATATVGAVSSEKHCTELRSLFLAEMVGRAMKALIRLLLRSYSRNIKGVSTHFKKRLLVEYFNVITGSNPRSNSVLSENVFETIKERFGPLAVLQSERCNMQYDIEPCTVYLIRRMQVMMGMQLSMACLAAFYENPVGFTFCDLDVLAIVPIVRFNMPLYPYAEAMTALLAAERAERDTYRYQVINDGATVFLRMCERKGSRVAENCGSLLKEFQTHYNRGAELEKIPGPEKFHPFSRCVGFQSGVLCALDTKFHPGSMALLAESHFSVEVHAKCTGGTDTLGIVLSGGRFTVSVTRENCWSFQLYIAQHSISLRLDPVVLNQWVYIAASYDGVTLRCYVDSRLVASVEIAEPILMKRREEAAKRIKSMADLDGQEKKEILNLRKEINQKVKTYFNSKEGIIKIKKMTRNVLQDDSFHDRDFGFTFKDDLTEAGKQKIKKSSAVKEAKKIYTEDIIGRMSRELTERFKQLRNEVVERASKEDSEGELRGRQPLRVGAAHSNSTSLTDTMNNFIGCIGLVAVYPLCLSADRVRSHFLAAHSGKAKEAQRLYALTSSKYEDALQFAHSDPLVLRGYAKTLCAYLRAEQNTQLASLGVAGAKIKVMEAISQYIRLNLPEGIGEILLELPRDPEYAEIMSFGFLSIKKLDASFFSRSTSLTRADMVLLPMIYGLDHPRSPLDYIAAAGGMYQEVCRDFDLRLSYGDEDLSWLMDVTSPELVIALVKNAKEDGGLRVFNMGEMFRASGRPECLSSVTDDDIKVVSEHAVLSQVFDLAGCTELTDISVQALKQCQYIRAINLDNCVYITDAGIMHLLDIAEGLQGLIPLFTACHRLKIVSVSNCPQITGVCLEILAENNKMLTTFSAAATQLSDRSFTLISSTFSRTHMTSVDVSMCVDITDSAIVTLAQSCPRLKHLNLCGTSRVTDKGIQAVCANCWCLETLNVEDVFLFDDAAFWFDPHMDGRSLADEKMLTLLSTLNLRDCVCVTDHGIKGLASRCRSLQCLILRGCDRITDKGLKYMTLTVIERLQHKQCMCESLKSLDLSFCSNVTAGNVASLLLPLCPGLQELHLSGILDVDDDIVRQVCQNCPSIQTLSLQKCMLVSDASLCWMADYLWLEALDISGCYRVTDDGLDVLTLACTGLQYMHVRRCAKITGRGVTCVGRNLFPLGLRILDLRDCPKVTPEAILDLQHKQRLVRLL